MMRAFLFAWLAFAIASSASAQTPAAKSKKTDKAAAGKSVNPLATDQPVTTEIYADEAFFDSQKNIGKFTGRVRVVDPRFNMQADKLTAYISKEKQGLEKAVADANVGVVRDRVDPKGGPPSRSIGLADHAVYTVSDGNVELSGNPRVQQGMNLHVATSAETVMILNQEGQLTTRGPSRTELRQEPKTSPTPAASAGESPAASPTATPAP